MTPGSPFFANSGHFVCPFTGALGCHPHREQQDWAQTSAASTPLTFGSLLTPLDGFRFCTIMSELCSNRGFLAGGFQNNRWWARFPEPHPF